MTSPEEALPRIEAVFALHLDPLSTSGTLCLREGAMMACADMFTVYILGKGGHGAVPHRTVDPIFVAAHVITALQGITSRRVNAMDAVVLSVCDIDEGALEAGVKAHAAVAVSYLGEKI